MRGEIRQWTAKAYKSCSTDKMANAQSIKCAALYLLSLTTLHNLHTHTHTATVWLEERQGNDKGRQLRLRKLSLCLRRDFQQKDARLCSRNMLTCASAATTAAHQGVRACVWTCVFARARQRCVFSVLASQSLFLLIPVRWLLCWCTPTLHGLLLRPARFFFHEDEDIEERKCERKQSQNLVHRRECGDLLCKYDKRGQICVMYVLWRSLKCWLWLI